MNSSDPLRAGSRVDFRTVGMVHLGFIIPQNPENSTGLSPGGEPDPRLIGAGGEMGAVRQRGEKDEEGEYQRAERKHWFGRLGNPVGKRGENQHRDAERREGAG